MTTGYRRRSARLERPIKQYALDQCALYGIKGIGQLLEVLEWRGSRGDLATLPHRRSAYRIWAEDGRQIEAAGAELRRVHVRIATLLRRVMPPGYRHSGVRGRSFLTNARCHLADAPSIKADIKHFYPSVTVHHVRRFFAGSMRCAPDVAALLASVCCVGGTVKHLPTGGVHSEVLAFYCMKACFDEIAARVEARGGVLSVYVDDIMLTMPGASHGDLYWMKRLFERHGIELHGADKSRVYRKHVVKTITGVRIHDGNLAAPPAQHRAIRDGLCALGDPRFPALERAHTARSLMGHLDHVEQIEPRFASRARGNRARLAALMRSDQP